MPKAATKKTAAKGKAKAKKDPDAPKRPAGAYIFFCSDKRPDVKKKQPDLTAPNVLKELGALWSKATDEEKKPFYAKAEKDKERFQKEDAAYKKKKAAEPEEDEDEDDE